MKNQDKNKPINRPDPEEHTLDVAIGVLDKLIAEKKNKQPEQDLAENTYIDATLAGFKRATEDDFKSGKIDKNKYDELMKILNRLE